MRRPTRALVRLRRASKVCVQTLSRRASPQACFILEPSFGLDTANYETEIQIMKSPRARGFTLTELLVTITIIVVLATVAFTASSRAISSANKAVCVSNLRGIGNALQICISERNGILPGPLFAGQNARYDPVQARTADKGRSLVNYIGPYMEDIRDTDNKPFLISNYGCPSLLKKLTVNTVASPPVVYRLEDKQNKLLTNRVPPEEFRYPWGYNIGEKPRRLDEINPRSAGKVRMITEQNVSLGVGGWGNGGATGPAHGEDSMAIFWDFSVRPVVLTEL
jgi:prepilin-type N-terminal cleavage/methylation domain-containing protein